MELLKCRRCTDPLTANNVTPSGLRGRICHPCRIAASRSWHLKNPNYNVEYNTRNKSATLQASKESQKQLRMQVLAAYGSKCMCCAETNIEFLGVDHAQGGRYGTVKPDKKCRSGAKLYRALKRAGFPPEFRLLCHNCNLSRGLYGYCPHEKNIAGLRRVPASVS